MTNTNPVNGLQVVRDVASNGSQALLTVIGDVLPILIPVFAAFWGIRFVLGKLGITQR